MSKGGDVDTSGMQAAAMAEMQLAADMSKLAKQEYAYGLGQRQRYATPILDQFMQIMGFNVPSTIPGLTSGGGGGKGAGGTQYPQSTPSGSAANFNPLMSQMFQPAVATEGESAAQAKANIAASDLGPAQKAWALQNVDIAKMKDLGTQAFGMVQNMMNAALGQGSMYQTGAGLANQSYGIAGGALGQAGNMFGNIANLEAQAAMSGNKLLGSALGMIGTLGGFALAGPMGGALGGMLGGGGGSYSPPASWNTFQNTPYTVQAPAWQYPTYF